MSDAKILEGTEQHAKSEKRKAVPIVLVAAAALIDTENRVLICKRPEGKSLAGLWEFPGGKVETGESPELALVRELKEELSIEVCETCLSPFTFASHTYEKFHLLMPLFLLRKWDGEIKPNVHPEIAWVQANRLTRYPMPPADIPMIPLLRDLLV